MSFIKKWYMTRVTAGGTGNDARDVRQLFVRLKDELVSHGYPVVASSDGVQAWDSDLISGEGAIVFPDKESRGNRSWVVFQLEKLGLYLCVAFDGSLYNRATFYVSREKFEGGTTMARPQAPAQVSVNRTPDWVTARGGTGGDYEAIVMSALDGSLRVIVRSHKQDADVVMLFDKVGDAAFVSVYRGPVAAGEVFGAGLPESGFVIHEVTGREVLATKAGTVNEISGEHMVFPVGVFSGGRKIGYVEDMWATPSPPAYSWDMIGNDYVVIGGNVFPWVSDNF